jgi:2-isopropylmalate synthase
VRLTAKGESQRVVGEGNGPVNALDHAVRNALLPAYLAVERFELIDYKVRILDQGHGTDATVRVLIETTDGLSAWTTVGVGQNIIEASWEALCEAYLYGLIHADDEVAVEVRAMSLDRG